MHTIAYLDGIVLNVSATSPFAGLVFALYVLAVVVTIYAGVRILNQAGYSGWWIVLALVPVLNFVMFLVFAFSKWPVRDELEAREQSDPGGRVRYTSFGDPTAGSGPGTPGYGGGQSG